MLEEKQFFKVKIPLENAISLIDSSIKSKHWDNFSVAELKLVYTPFWFFSFDAFEQKENKAISKHHTGKKTLNAKTNELSDFLAGFPEKDEAVIEKEVSKEFPSEILDAKISSQEAKEVASVRIASNLGFVKENVLISGLELFFVPLWVTFVTVNNQNFRIQINAVSGDTSGAEKVPEREKGFLEITQETINDLKSPGAWVEYSKQASKGVTSVFSKGGETSTSGFKNIKWDWKVIVIIIAILFILAIISGLV